mmetsp:Transcript_16833/g.31880  ORF Transcript_16833/g.31880 Transcript_16833/m.31880 type:complete len:680 (+) Transcript_16833:161-2200(+)|eukprot:CAMPEP_0176480442 /NCGR_PEP_ID=MMETSP0200_2-20121128/2278_1 /TAXON_ID=947934 /ORGANISM="Chaetoceros sp., Strain GSL56" /LENGTH=679 /DNA_ID=CAMNT_0017876559 /DNA_START=66 /DNA_END=2105 /DNA_ORIENTATION=+
MIVYGRGAQIYETLFRIHGSALYKGVLPGLISTSILLILVLTSSEPSYDLSNRWFTHPYPISAMLAAFTFLLTFKCSFSYNRYWEACSSVFQMQSKWLDAGLQLAAWHLQSNRYMNIKPPTFGEHPDLNSVLRKRKVVNRVMSPDELKIMLEKGVGGDSQGISAGGGGGAGGDNNTNKNNDPTKGEDEEKPAASTTIVHNRGGPPSFLRTKTRINRIGGSGHGNKTNTSSSSLFRQRNASIWKRIGNREPMNKYHGSFHAVNNDCNDHSKSNTTATVANTTNADNNVVQGRNGYGKSIHAQSSTRGSFSMTHTHTNHTNTYTNTTTATTTTALPNDKPRRHTINNTSDMERTPFHHKRMTSQIISVANLDGGMERDEYPSPFLQEASHLLSLLSAVAFTTLRNDLHRAPAPLSEYEVGSPWPPVDPDADKNANYYEMNSFLLAVNYLLGNVRTDAQRTVYNSCRPLKVLGGVSDAEIDMLQRARGPVAKTSLCMLWLQEFISREYESGALGKTAPPIVSRIYQVISDGALGYNQARKVAYIPFPFPHTQLTTFYIVVITLFMPVLMLTFVSNTIAAAVTNFFTVGVFLGLWHVSTELEDPFRNVPNDLPLNNFQAQFNEALVVMFAGFHPEAWWDIDDNLEGISLSDLLLHPPSLQPHHPPTTAAGAVATPTNDSNDNS